MDKVDIINEDIILTGTGQVGLAQRFRSLVETYWQQGKHQGKTHVDIGRELCALGRADFGSTGLGPGQYSALLAFVINGSCHLCEFALADFQPEFKQIPGGLAHVTAGSGQPIADPFLGFLRELFWPDRLPTLPEATFATLWTLKHTIQFNPGGINGPARMAVLKKDATTEIYRASLLTDRDMEEHYSNIAGAEDAIRKYKKSFSEDVVLQTPPPAVPAT
jgi:hypothetical protein